MPPKWRTCSGLFGYVRRYAICALAVAEVRGNSAEDAKVNTKDLTQSRKAARAQRECREIFNREKMERNAEKIFNTKIP